MSAGFASFRDSVIQHFGYLLDDHGFEIVYEQESDDAHALLILGSDKYRLRLIHDRGTIQADVGAADAPSKWIDEHDGERVWFNLYSLAEFLEGRRLTLEEIRAHGRALQSMTMDESAGDLAETLRRIAAEIEELFGAGANSEQRRALHAYFSSWQL